MANVFISHRLSDNKEAEVLAQKLEVEGHTVWLDLMEIGLGDSITAKMNEGLEGSSYLILCYSSSGVSSPWISREWLAVLARQLDGEKVKILPILLTGGKPPAILADIKYADLVKDPINGMAQLLKAIK